MGSDDEESTTIASEVVAAMAGGAISASVLYPLEVIKTRMQAVNNATATATQTAAEDLDVDDEEEDDADDLEEEYFDSATQQQQQQQQQQQKQARAHHRGASSSPRGGGGGRSKKTTPPQPQRQQQQQQLSMIPFAKQLFEREGGRVFLRGVETSAFQSALEKSLYFFAYTALKEAHGTLTGNHKLDAATNLALGCAAEWAHLPVTLPVDAWTTAIQTSGSTADDRTSKAPMQILLTMLSDKDTNFYKGISAYYLLCFKPALQYTVYEQVKAAVVQTRTNKTLSAGEAFVLGMIARVVATVVVFPFLRAKVIMQTQQKQKKQERRNGGNNNDNNNGAAEANGDGSGNDSSNGNGILSVLWQQWEHGGIGGLYHGLGPELTRGVFSAALMLMIKERIALVVRRMLVPSSTITRRHRRRPLPRSSRG